MQGVCIAAHGGQSTTHLKKMKEMLLVEGEKRIKVSVKINFLKMVRKNLLSI
jgi:hypothetical protein